MEQLQKFKSKTIFKSLKKTLLKNPKFDFYEIAVVNNKMAL